MISTGIGSIGTAGTLSNVGCGGDFFQALVSTSIAPSGALSLPFADGIFVIPDINGQIQVNLASASLQSSTSWINFASAGVPAFAVTDGYILQVKNNSASVASILKYTIMK